MKLYVNLDVLDNTIATYQNETSKVSESLKELDGIIESMKNGDWETYTSKELISLYEGDWRSKIEENMALLNHLKDCLIDARDAYYEQFNKAIKLGKEI